MLTRIALLCGIALPLAAATPPLVDYVTYLGGSYADTVAGIAVDSTGSAYVAGNTSSPDFPVTSTSLGSPSIYNRAFITKFNPSGTAIDFSICLGNSVAIAFAVDANGNLYLAVENVDNPFVISFSVVKLDPTAESILYSAPIGGNPEAIALDAAGDIFVTGTAGPGLATTPGVYQSQSSPGQCTGDTNAPPFPCSVAFITKLTPSGSVAWSTYLGGSGPDDGHAIAVDSTGNVWVAGQTVSPNFPTTANAISRKFGGEIDVGPLRLGDAFVSKLDPTGSHLLYSTYLGGTQADAASSIAVDSAGAAYISGGTGSPNFPTTPGAFQTAQTGNAGFVTKIDGSGALVYSTFVSAGGGLVVDSLGQAYVSAIADAFASIGQPTCASPPNQEVVVLNSTGSALVGSSPIPGAYLALDGKGGLYSAGDAFTGVFFSTPRAFQTQYGGGNSDAFAAKVDFSQPAGPSIASVVNAASLFPGYETPFATGAVAPGEIVTLFGNGFGLAKPAVTFGTFPATVLYSSDCQINAVVPFDVNPGLNTLVTVQAGDQTLGPIKLPVVVAAPGIFTTILNQDSSVNSASNPAARGSIVSVYMTGVGALSPQIADGSVGPLMPPFPAPVANLSASIGEVNAPIIFAGQAPGLIAGATQVNLQIPQDAPVGAEVTIAIYAAYYYSAASIAVR